MTRYKYHLIVNKDYKEGIIKAFNYVDAISYETSTGQMKRTFEDLVAYLYRELDFPHGAFLMTGTGLVPPDDFTLKPGDGVTITIGELVLENVVQ